MTLIDFAADRRAPTPTAAAEMAVPVRSELKGDIDSLARRGLACWRRGIELRRTELRACIRAWPTPDALLAVPRQRVDAAFERLPRALKANAQIHLTQYSRIAVRLSPQMLRVRIVRDGERVNAIVERTRRAARAIAQRRDERLAVLAARLAVGLRSNRDAHRLRIGRERERLATLSGRARRAAIGLIERRAATLGRVGQVLSALSYQGVLARGFVLVRDPEGRPLRAAATISPGMRLDLEFADGHVGAVAEPATGPRPSPSISGKPRGGRGPSDAGQGNLFGG